MSAQTTPEVSVIIPVYNGARYLGPAIESVLAQAGSLELLVVDDGSEDGSLALAQSFAGPVRCLSQENRGAAAARNLGVSQARGRCFAFLDADDLWTAGKLALQLRALAEQPELDMVFGQAEHFVSPELDADAAAALQCPRGAQPCQTAGSMLVSRQAFQRVGAFDESWQIGEVVDWYARAVEAGLQSLMLPQVVLRRRLHTRNAGRTKRGDYRDYARIVKAALDRRRAARPPPTDAP